MQKFFQPVSMKATQELYLFPLMLLPIFPHLTFLTSSHCPLPLSTKPQLTKIDSAFFETSLCAEDGATNKSFLESTNGRHRW